ncbi:hypothetical protein, partial [Nonomuraea typhae]|uniref:hypothetical protein n=1 Tax=Nonomuraea typhae TaxID=2603600 RepID=UPI001CA566CC
SSRCGKIASNFAASISTVSASMPIPHHRTGIRDATSYFSASPKLLSRYLIWFQAHIADEPGSHSVATLIRRALRSYRSGPRLRDAMLAWQRLAYLTPNETEAFDALLETMRADQHPAVRQLLTVLDQQY